MRASIPHPGRAGHPVRKGPVAVALLWAIALSLAHADPGKTAEAAAKAGPRTVAVLDPVDLNTNLPDPIAGRLLRRGLEGNPAWRVLPGDSLAKQLRDVGMDPDMPCTEFQCAFDAGNALQSEFVLFGTSTDLPDFDAYTLGLAHIPTSQTVWSRVGQAPKRSVAGRRMIRQGTMLEGPLKFAVSDLDPSALDLRKRPRLGLLGVVDGGQSTPHSRVAMYRALAHAYAARSYDLLGPAELESLVDALDLEPVDGSLAAGTGPGAYRGVGGSARERNAADMLDLGKRIGVRYLLRSEVRTSGREYALDLSLFDVAAGRKIRAWPTRGTSDFSELLGLEDRFMTALGEGGEEWPARRPATRHPWRNFFKGTSIGLAVAGAGALGYMAWKSHEQADRAYDDFLAARTRDDADQARERVVEQDAEARNFGILGGLTLALGVAVWAF